MTAVLLLLFFVSSILSCSPGTPFYPKQWVKWIEEGATTTTEMPELPTPAPLVAPDPVSSPTEKEPSNPLTWKQISVQEMNNFRPADSFSDIYRRLEQKNMQHLMAVEPEGQRPPWI